MISADPGAPDRFSAALAAELREVRRGLGAPGPLEFARVYLGGHFTLAPSPMHTEVAALLRDATFTRGQRLAVAAPRGHAKSTLVSLAYVLWSLACEHEPFVWLVSAAREQAVVLLKHVRDEVEHNPLLWSDFPRLCPSRDRRARPALWRGGALQFPSGAVVRAVGLDQPVRGLRNRQYRPSLMVLDDIETTETVHTAEQRQKLRTQVEQTLLKAGDSRTNVVVVGTVLHYDSFLAGLVRPHASPGWTGRKYKALIRPPDRADLWGAWESIYSRLEEYEGGTGPQAARRYLEAISPAMHEGSQVLWPEKDPLAALMEMRLREGQRSFDSEKQNEPLDPELCLFREPAFRYWDDVHPDEASLLRDLQVQGGYLLHGAWDPCMGRSATRGDYGAVIVLARQPGTGVCDVLAADLARRPPHDAIARIIELARMYRFASFAVEENGFQALLVQQMADAALRAGVDLPIRAIRQTADKHARIQLLEPLVRQGAIRFSRRHTLLLEQLRQFPLGAHDDGPDALELAVRASREHRRPWRERIGEITL